MRRSRVSPSLPPGGAINTPSHSARPRSKYKAIRTELDGISFASKREASRYATLKLSEKIGEISNLQLQPKFPIEINGEKICTYIGDFRYFQNGNMIVEDVKGVKTPIYKLKKKLVEALYPGVKILEV